MLPGYQAQWIFYLNQNQNVYQTVLILCHVFGVWICYKLGAFGLLIFFLSSGYLCFLFYIRTISDDHFWPLPGALSCSVLGNQVPLWVLFVLRIQFLDSGLQDCFQEHSFLLRIIPVSGSWAHSKHISMEGTCGDVGAQQWQVQQWSMQQVLAEQNTLHLGPLTSSQQLQGSPRTPLIFGNATCQGVCRRRKYSSEF